MAIEVTKKGVLNAILNGAVAQLAVKAVLLLISGAIVLSPFCMTRVQEHELVMLSNFGKLDETLIQPGLHWFWPFLYEVHRYDTRPKDFDIEGLEKTERELEKVQGIGSQSFDGWHVGVITHIHYSLDKNKAKNIVESFGKDDSDESRQAIEKRIEVEVRHAVQNLLPQLEVGYLLSNRDELGVYVLTVLGLFSEIELKNLKNTKSSNIDLPLPLHPNTKISELGIVIHYISFELDLPKEYSEERVLAAQNKEQIKTLTQKLIRLSEEEKVKEKELSIANMEAIKNAETQAQVLRLLNEENKNVSPILRLIEKWDGSLPEIVTDKTFIDSIIEDGVKFSHNKSSNRTQ